MGWFLLPFLHDFCMDFHTDSRGHGLCRASRSVKQSKFQSGNSYSASAVSSNSGTLIGNKNVDLSDVVATSPVGTAPTIWSLYIRDLTVLLSFVWVCCGLVYWQTESCRSWRHSCCHGWHHRLSWWQIIIGFMTAFGIQSYYHSYSFQSFLADIAFVIYWIVSVPWVYPR